MTTPNEPKTIREYIAARKTELRGVAAFFEKAELERIQHWLDAHEPKAVGAETKVPAFEVQTCYGQFFVKDCKRGRVICMCTTDDEASRIAAMLAKQKKGQP